jgi:hypothetical protein
MSLSPPRHPGPSTHARDDSGRTFRCVPIGRSCRPICAPVAARRW